MKNEYIINKQRIKEWSKEYHLHDKTSIRKFVAWFVIGCVGLLALIVSITSNGNWLYICSSVVLVLTAIYQLVFSRFTSWRIRYKACAHHYGVPEWVRTHEFTEEEIILTDHTFVTDYQYEDIEDITEKGNTVMIWFPNNYALRLYKDAFVEGSWEACKEFISQKRRK
jgi:hypothetical protein